MSLCWFFLETDQVPCSTTTAASASARKAVIRVDVALATDWLHQTNLPSQTQIRQNIRLYYSVRRQGRKALKVSLPISPPWLHSCGMYKYDSCVSSKLWPTYFPFFFVRPSNMHLPPIDWCLWKMTWKNHLFFVAEHHFVVFQAIFVFLLAVRTTDCGIDGLLCEVPYSHCTGMFQQPIMFPSSSCWHNRSESQ